MVKYGPLFALLALGFAPAPLPKPDPSRIDLNEIQGQWIRVGCTVAGVSIRDPLQVTEVEVAGDRMKYAGPGVSTPQWTILLDARKKPKVLDVTGSDGAEKGVTYWGVYRLEGDTLTLCARKGGSPSVRPRDFAGTDQGVIVEVFKRRKR
jgi:uncharacterized protein (TIGR03067 family)